MKADSPAEALAIASQWTKTLQHSPAHPRANLHASLRATTLDHAVVAERPVRSSARLSSRSLVKCVVRPDLVFGRKKKYAVRDWHVFAFRNFVTLEHDHESLDTLDALHREDLLIDL